MPPVRAPLSALQFLVRPVPVRPPPDILDNGDGLQRLAIQEGLRGSRVGGPVDIFGALQDMCAAQHPQRPVLAPRLQPGEEPDPPPLCLVGLLHELLQDRRSSQPALHNFGHEAVAEVTGRSRRVLRITDAKGERLALRSRPGSANLAETAAFMDGEKRILVFSMAGGTGRSYHADLSCGNTERRIHYLLEPGWRADQAIQGLGRTHRTHQASAPMFRPVTTDVKGERRFIATIARRLDSLGAITRGQRDSQLGHGRFRRRRGRERSLAAPDAVDDARRPAARLVRRNLPMFADLDALLYF